MTKSKRKNDASEYPAIITMIGRKVGAIFIFGWRAAIGLVAWIWRLTWQFTNWVLRQITRVGIWFMLTPWRLVKQLWSWFSGTPIVTGDTRLDALTNLIRRYYRRRNRFITHLFIFSAVNIGLWLDKYIDKYRWWYDNEAIRNNVWFTIIWFCLLAFHFIRLRLGDAEDNALRAVLEKNYENAPRPKRHIAYEEPEEYVPSRLQLTEDGESSDYSTHADRVVKNH